jgi:rRNA maturation endonuclease Nob1
MIIICDFDGTLALGNYSHITVAEPNIQLIERLRKAKEETGVYIKITTARGGKRGLTDSQKRERYLPLIEEFCSMWNVPYDEISFNKEYGDLYIDDMTISQHDDFSTMISPFTKNKVLFTEKSVIKESKSSLFERRWYDIACNNFLTPNVLFCNDDTIITERIYNHQKPTAEQIIELVQSFKELKIKNYPFGTYTQNIKIHEESTKKVKDVIKNLKEHEGTFFHGDLSTTNVLSTESGMFLIDPNYKGVFGSWKTDAGKAVFSFVAYEKDWDSASKICKALGDDIWGFAVAEGLRVVKNKPELISIINNIANEI